jgi:hypothetical protein
MTKAVELSEILNAFRDLPQGERHDGCDGLKGFEKVRIQETKNDTNPEGDT